MELRYDRILWTNARYNHAKNMLAIEDKPVPITIAAKNGGYNVEDFMEILRRIGSCRFCFVHFTAFRY